MLDKHLQHLLNERACGYLKSEAAASCGDKQVVARLLHLPIEPAIPRKLKKPWLHNAFDEEGNCRFCGGRVTSPNTSIKKNHLLNPNACRYST